jgi:hypothetical protein
VLDCNDLATEELWDGQLCCEVCRVNGKEPSVCGQRVKLEDGRSFLLCCKALEMLVREGLADMPDSA